MSRLVRKDPWIDLGPTAKGGRAAQVWNTRGSYRYSRMQVPKRTTSDCLFPAPGPTGTLPGGGGETGGGVPGRRVFELHPAEVCQRYWCCSFRSGLTRLGYTAWFVWRGDRLLRAIQWVRRRVLASEPRSVESSGRIGKKARNPNTI